MAPAGGRQPDSARRSAVRRRSSVPQGYRKRPAGKVPHNGIGERGDAECNACRYASSVPMTTKPGDGRAAPSAEREGPVGLPGHTHEDRRPRLKELLPSAKACPGWGMVAALAPCPRMLLQLFGHGIQKYAL
jgi:hypothetical protein